MIGVDLNYLADRSHFASNGQPKHEGQSCIGLTNAARIGRYCS